MTARTEPHLEQAAKVSSSTKVDVSRQQAGGEPARAPRHTPPTPRRLVPVFIASSGAALGPLEPLTKDTAR